MEARPRHEHALIRFYVMLVGMFATIALQFLCSFAMKEWVAAAGYLLSFASMISVVWLYTHTGVTRR